MSKNAHTTTYTSFKLKDLFHKRRLSFLQKLAKRTFRSPKSYCDFGSSEGYVTNVIAETINTDNVFCFDGSPKNIKAGREKYGFEFSRVNLNDELDVGKYQAVSCFETLEHVLQLEVGVNNVLRARAPDGAFIISVPNEVGLLGFVKAVFKLCFYGYSLEELKPSTTRLQYLVSVLKGERISKWRGYDRPYGYGTHFGFDYRDIDDILQKSGENYSMIKSGTTVFFVTPNQS